MKKNTLAILLILTLLCLSLCACRDIHTPDPAESSAESMTAELTAADTQPDTEDTESTASAAVEPSIPVQLPVDIDTIGGVVLVGTIGFDDGGWYFKPDQPLNITYQYFLDNPSVFSMQRRIAMFDPAVDGVEKAIYLGQTVTAAGTFRFYRDDYETLYFSPYTITIGKNAAQSYAAPDLVLQDAPENRYNPAEPLPKCMDTMIEDGAYFYNAFMLSRETLELMGNDFAVFYVGFVDAFLNYETEFPCPDKRYAELLSTVIYDEFPLYNACAEPFEFFRHYDAEKGTVSITYKYDIEEYKQIKEQFFNAANALLRAAKPEQSDEEKARSLYHALCSKMTYDYSALEIFERKESYYAYLYNSGVCVTFANVYNQLLTQVGIDTTLAHCDSPDTIGHSWSVITLDGKQYFCDPTYELSYDNGTGYRYFGMNYADRTAGGLGAQGIRYGRYHLRALDAEMIALESLK